MSKGFTLIELLIVIGILAILATATVLVLNPAELLAQARDSQRLSDLDAMRSATALYLGSVDGANLNNGGASKCSNEVGAQYGITVAGATKMLVSPGAEARAGLRAVNGTGWISVKFSDITGGAPFGSLPIDPTNVSPYSYQYGCQSTNKTFEFDTLLESAKYRGKGANAQDNGNGVDIVVGAVSVNPYEVGTDLTL